MRTTPARRQHLRGQLLDLHRSLIQEERADYELLHGKVASGAFLNVLVSEPELAWLQPLTRELVALDEPSEEPWDALSARVRGLLAVEGRYGALYERSPDVAFAHASALHALR